MLLLDIPFAKKDWAKAQAPGRVQWDPMAHTWFFRGTSREELPDSLQPYYVGLSPAEPVRPSAQFHVLCLPFTYQKFASEHGSKWHPRFRVSYWHGDKANLPLSLTGFECKAFSYEAYVQDLLNNRPTEVVPPSRAIVLRPDQTVAVGEIRRAFDAGYPGFLLADEVGLGKTITSWAAVLQHFKRPTRIAVVSPLSVHPNWRDTIKAMGNGGHTVVILNYERLRNLYDEPADTAKKAKQIGKRRALKRIANQGTPKPFDVYLFDESHHLKNLEAARSKLGVGLYRADTHHIWLSATAGQDVLELGYLLPILQAKTHGIAEMEPPSPNDFEVWYKSADIHVNRGSYGKWVVGADENERREDCKRMAAILWDPDPRGIKIALRRTPEDIAGWPSLQRIPWAVELTDDEMRKYNIEWKAFLEAFHEEKRTSKVVSAAGSAALLRFRMKASLLRAKHTADFAEELIQSGQQCAISVQWEGTLLEIAKELERRKVPYARITGKEVGDQREAERKRYQTGAAKAALFTIEVGINLHQGEVGGNDVCRSQINHDLRWSAIAMHQIDGRSQRAGKFAKSYWAYAEETRETHVATKLLEKLKSMKTMLGETDFKMEELERAFLGGLE